MRIGYCLVLLLFFHSVLLSQDLNEFRFQDSFDLRQYRYFDDSHKHQVFYDEFHVGESLEEVSIYNTLPAHYEVTDELRFIEIHK